MKQKKVHRHVISVGRSNVVSDWVEWNVVFVIVFSVYSSCQGSFILLQRLMIPISSVLDAQGYAVVSATVKNHLLMSIAKSIKYVKTKWSKLPMPKHILIKKMLQSSCQSRKFLQSNLWRIQLMGIEPMQLTLLFLSVQSVGREWVVIGRIRSRCGSYPVWKFLEVGLGIQIVI